MWTDLQESFFITMAPFVQNILFPGLLAGGLLLAIGRAISVLFSGGGRHGDA